MEKILVNITSYKGSWGAEHYYGSIRKIDNDLNVYIFANNEGMIHVALNGNSHSEDVERIIDAKEAEYLNKKDGKGSKKMKAGDLTSRHQSIQQIKDIVLERFKENDIIFTIEGKMTSEDMYVYERNKETYSKTGKKLKIQNFTGHSREFANLTEGSIHEILETPLRYRNDKTYNGYWVMGVSEPVLVLFDECEVIKKSEAEKIDKIQ